MKKVLSFSPMVFTIVFLFVSACEIAAMCLECDFSLYNASATIAVTALLIGAAAASMLLLKAPVNRGNAVFSAIALPAAVLYCLFFIYALRQPLTAVSMLVVCGSALVIFIKYAKPGALKICSGIFAALLALLLVAALSLKSVFGDFGLNTVARELISPERTYIAYVIDSDQGALGGDTFVEVQDMKKRWNVLIGQFQESPRRIYSGEWKEYQTMEIEWKDENTLLIDGQEYNMNK